MLVLLGATALLIAMPLSLFSGEWKRVATVVALFPLTAYFAVSFYIRPYVEVTPDEVIVRNLMTLYRIPRSLTVKRTGIRAVGLDVQGHGHIPALAYAVGVTGKRQCLRLAAAVEEAPPLPACTAVRRRTVEKTRPSGATEVLMCVATVTLCVLAAAA
ncbi:hypothetical protein ACWCWD_19290 [Streptomyces sp. NPDC001493]